MAEHAACTGKSYFHSASLSPYWTL
jgi:hypothetical protein